MPSITLAFDAGTSGSKVIASYPSSGKCVFNDENYFFIAPSVRHLTKQTYEDYLEYLEGQVEINSSLVSYCDPSTGKEVYCQVGQSASRPGMLWVQQRKFENLLVKILALLGYLVKSRVKTSEEVHLNLGVLLPLDEIEDRAILAKWLRKIIGEQGFCFNGYEIKNIVVKTINCKPEGYGIYKSNASAKVGILMIGHSDLSWLFFNQGYFLPELSKTFPGSGMHGFLKNLKFPIQDELLTSETIVKAGVKLDRKVLATLTQTKTNDECDLLIQAIELASSQYWCDREQELKSLNITQADLISVGGGAANYFSWRLNQLFKEEYGIRLNWCKTLATQFKANFSPKSFSKSIALFLDCYGFYQLLNHSSLLMSKNPGQKTLAS